MLLYGSTGDLRVHLDDTLHALTDARQAARGIAGGTDTRMRLLLPGLHLLHGSVGGALQLLDDAANFFGRRLGARSQCADFISHHGKSATLLARPRGFDGSIEGQQIGLIGNGADDLDNATNRLTVQGQRLDLLGTEFHFFGQRLNGRVRLMHDAQPVT